MNQAERRRYLIQYLLKEEERYQGMKIPESDGEQKAFLRALLNVRSPKAADEDFLKVQDEYLRERAAEKGIVTLEQMEPLQDGIYLWQGDITRLKVDAIVNAANSGMTGCYQPNHTCIDNCIHTFGGIQMRLACADLMAKQGFPEPTGQAKITPAYNLPCRYVLHTVGPIIYNKVSRTEEELLSSCYRSCLALAKEKGLGSVAFCCISTGVFHFPNERAAEIAIETVKQFQSGRTDGAKDERIDGKIDARADRERDGRIEEKRDGRTDENESGKNSGDKNRIKVVFNVFQEKDYEIYRRLLTGTGKFQIKT